MVKKSVTKHTSNFHQKEITVGILIILVGLVVFTTALAGSITGNSIFQFSNSLTGKQVARSPPLTWAPLVAEGQPFTVSGTKAVRYGAAGHGWRELVVTGSGQCTNQFFGGDPAVGVYKTCQLGTSPQSQPSSTSTGSSCTFVPIAFGTPGHVGLTSSAVCAQQNPSSSCQAVVTEYTESFYRNMPSCLSSSWTTNNLASFYFTNEKLDGTCGQPIVEFQRTTCSQSVLGNAGTAAGAKRKEVAQKKILCCK